MDDDKSGVYFVCSEPSPRVFVIQRLSRQDAIRYCGDSKENGDAGDGGGGDDAPPSQPKLHAPMPVLPWWFNDDVMGEMREFDPSKHATSLREADSALVDASGTPLSSSEQLRHQLRAQLEYYFSRENLITDRYLRCQMDADQYVPIKIISNFPKIIQLTSDIGLIVQVLRESPNVQVDEGGEKVRATSRRCTILIREIPETEEEEVKVMLEGTAPYHNLTYGFNNTWYVSFESEDATQRAFMHLQNLGKTFNDKPICARIKTGGCPNAPEQNRSHSATPTDISKSSTSQKTFNPTTTPITTPTTDAVKSVAATPDAERVSTSPPSVPTVNFDLGQLLMSMGFTAKSAFKPNAPVVHFTCNNAPEAPPVSTSSGVTVNVAYQSHHMTNGGCRSPVRGHRSPRASPLFFGHNHHSNYHNSGPNGGSYLAASAASNGYHNHYRGTNNASSYGNSKLSPQCAASSSTQYSGGRRSSNFEFGKFYKGKRVQPPPPSNSYLNPPGISNGGAPHRYRNGNYSSNRGIKPRFPVSPSRMYERSYPRFESISKKVVECVVEVAVPEEEKPAEKQELHEAAVMSTAKIVMATKRAGSTCEGAAPASNSSDCASITNALTTTASKAESVYSFEEGEFPSLPEKERVAVKKEVEKPPPFSVIVAGRQKMEAKREAEAAAAASRFSYAQSVSRKAALASSNSAVPHS